MMIVHFVWISMRMLNHLNLRENEIGKVATERNCNIFPCSRSPFPPQYSVRMHFVKPFVLFHFAPHKLEMGKIPHENRRLEIKWKCFGRCFLIIFYFPFLQHSARVGNSTINGFLFSFASKSCACVNVVEWLPKCFSLWQKPDEVQTNWRKKKYDSRRPLHRALWFAIESILMLKKKKKKKLENRWCWMARGNLKYCISSSKWSSCSRREW